MKVDAGVDARRGTVDLERAEPGNAAHLRVDDPLNEGSRDGCVHRIAAAHEHLRARFGSFRLSADDHRHRPRVHRLAPRGAKGCEQTFDASGIWKASLKVRSGFIVSALQPFWQDRGKPGQSDSVWA